MKLKLSVIAFAIILTIMCWATLKLEEEYPEVVYISTEEFSGLNTEEVIMEVDETYYGSGQAYYRNIRHTIGCRNTRVYHCIS